MATENTTQPQLQASLIEEIQSYDQGGNHPVHLGDLLENRYEVVHKLGSGDSGLVWLCLDTSTTKWRAVKIMTANQSAVDGEKIDSHLKQSSLDELQKNHLLVPLEEFWIAGPNGKHQCLVLPVVGPTVKSWLDMVQSLKPTRTLPDAKLACYQIARAVQFLHSLGLYHGDIKPEYVRMDLKGLEDFDKAEMLELLGGPEMHEIKPESGASPAPHAPKYVVSPPSGDWWEKLATSSIRLTNFSKASLKDAPPSIDRSSRAYAAPEVVWKTKVQPGPQSDIWSLAATIYEIIDTDPLFDGEDNGSLAKSFEYWLGGHARTPERRYSTLELALEKRDDEEISTGYSDRYEVALGREREYRPNLLRRNLTEEDRNVAIKYKYPREEVVALADLLRKMLRYEADERMGIEDVLKHPSFDGCEKLLPRAGTVVRAGSPNLGAIATAAAVAAGVHYWKST